VTFDLLIIALCALCAVGAAALWCHGVEVAVAALEWDEEHRQ
jgi:hypothetical protein